MLIEMPNGDWVAADSVGRLFVIPTRNAGAILVVRLKGGLDAIHHQCGSEEEARRHVREVAARCNAFLAPLSSPPKD